MSARWCLVLPAVVAVVCGARYTYVVFVWVWGAVGVLVVLRGWAEVLGRGIVVERLGQQQHIVQDQSVTARSCIQLAQDGGRENG